MCVFIKSQRNERRWKDPPQNPSISAQACSAQSLRWKDEDAETFQSLALLEDLVKYLLPAYVASGERSVKDDTYPWRLLSLTSCSFTADTKLCVVWVLNGKQN